MDHLLFESCFHSNPAIQQLQAYAQPWLRTFEGLNMLEYSKHHDFEISNFNHPLDDAHRALYQYAQTNFLDRKTT
jgi:hypothetical protein